MRTLARATCSLLTLLALIVGSRLHAQDRKAFNPPGSPTNLPFSNGIQVGDLLWVAGTLGTVSGDITEETRSALIEITSVAAHSRPKP